MTTIKEFKLFDKAAEMLEQLAACHDEPTCPAVQLGIETAAEIRAFLKNPTYPRSGTPRLYGVSNGELVAAQLEEVAVVQQCEQMGGQTLHEVDGRWKFLRYGTRLYVIDEALPVGASE